jgi:hypothetical protein
VRSRGVERLEHDLAHLLTVDFQIERSLGEEDGVLLAMQSSL